MTHPAAESLIPLLDGGGDAAVARHVESCAVCRAELARLRDSARALRETASLASRSETPECLDEETIVDFAEGRLPYARRPAVVAHLAGCARCRDALVGTSRLLADTTVVTAPATERRWSRWSVPIGIAAAAAILLVVRSQTVDRVDTSDQVRGGAAPVPGDVDTTRAGPLPIQPRASVERVDRLVWSSVPGALRYRVRLYDDQSAVRWSIETEDTLAVLPDSVRLSPQLTYFWKAEAQMDWQRWVSSDLVEFRILRPQP
jgi:hypothetical protein